MSTGFPCPNPTCAEVFPPEAVQGAARLVCPRCGTVFQFRAPNAAAPSAPRAAPAKPPSRRPPAPATVLPVAAPVPVALPVQPQAPPAALAFDAGPGEVARGGRRRRRRGRSVWLVLGLLLGLLAAGALAVLAVLGMRHYLADDGGDLATAAPRYNFSFQMPGRGWQRNREAERRLGAPFALSRRDPRSTLALHFRDYKTREPGQAELLDEAVKLLRGQFEPLQYQDPFTVKPADRTARLGDEPAWVVEFVGTDRGEQVAMAGECHMLTRRGFAYWFFTWGPAPDRDQLAPRWEAVRQGFRLLDGRDGWSEQPRETAPFDGGRYRLDYAKEVWDKYDKPADYDEAAELVLQGFEPTVDEATGKARRLRDTGKMATVKVLLLPAAKGLPAAAAAARAHLREQARKEHPEGAVEVELEKDPSTGKPVLDGAGAVGGFRGHRSRLRVALDKDSERYAHLAVVALPDRTLAVVGECPWGRRDFWRREFEQVLDTLAKPRLKGW